MYQRKEVISAPLSLEYGKPRCQSVLADTRYSPLCASVAFAVPHQNRAQVGLLGKALFTHDPCAPSLQSRWHQQESRGSSAMSTVKWFACTAAKWLGAWTSLVTWEP